MKPWLLCNGHSVCLTLHVQPGANKTEAAGEHGDCLKIRLAAPPVDGKANAALIAWLAALFDAPRRDVELVSGDKSRHKVVLIASELDAAARLALLTLQ